MYTSKLVTIQLTPRHVTCGIATVWTYISLFVVITYTRTSTFFACRFLLQMFAEARPLTISALILPCQMFANTCSLTKDTILTSGLVLANARPVAIYTFAFLPLAHTAFTRHCCKPLCLGFLTVSSTANGRQREPALKQCQFNARHLGWLVQLMKPRSQAACGNPVHK